MLQGAAGYMSAGQLFDVKDAAGEWLPAFAVNPQGGGGPTRFHFCGWPERFDEVRCGASSHALRQLLFFCPRRSHRTAACTCVRALQVISADDTSRVAPYQSRTAGKRAGGYFVNQPVSVEAHADVKNQRRDGCVFAVVGARVGVNAFMGAGVPCLALWFDAASPLIRPRAKPSVDGDALRAGHKLDACDTADMWLEATVKDVRGAGQNRQLFVHYGAARGVWSCACRACACVSCVGVAWCC